MSQHFLLTAKARSLSLAKVARLSDEEAYQTFKLIRWAATDGQPVCPRCGCVAVYTYATRKLFKCKACNHQFSVTSGTIFASLKLPIRDGSIANHTIIPFFGIKNPIYYSFLLLRWRVESTMLSSVTTSTSSTRHSDFD